MTDVELLTLHRNGSESAFADLVRRHLDWVYSLARRRLRDAHLAEDVAQAVFVLLHRKAPPFAADAAMMSWLYRTAWFTCESAARTQRRRRGRETQYARQRPETIDPPEPPEWKELAPVLDKLIGQLSTSDREVILLRYYRDLTAAQIAAETGTTPEAARKRVERATDRLRQLATREGIAMTSSALTTGLLQFVKLPAPPGLLATSTVAATAPAGSAMAASSASIVKGGLAMMAGTKIAAITVTAVAIVLAAATITAGYWAFNSLSNSPPPTAQTTASTPLPAPPPPLSVPKQLPAQTPQLSFAADNRYPKLAPFTSVRWRGDIPEIQIGNKTWYELVSINNFPVSQVIEAQRTRDPMWRKHFAEDLVEMFGKMNHPLERTVDLQLLTLDAAKSQITLGSVPMTEANRAAVMYDAPENPNELFSTVRWVGDTPQVRIHATWYELLAVEDLPTAKLIDLTKKTYGDNWRTHFQANWVDAVNRLNGGELRTATVKLLTLDSNEQVTIEMPMPMPSPR